MAEPIVGKTVEISACFILVSLCMTLCKIHGYIDFPEWMIWSVFGIVALFWAAAIVLAFIAGVVCIIMREIQKNSRQDNLNKGTEEDW